MPQLAGDHVQVLVDGYELTADSNRISIPDSRDLYDVSSFGDATHKFIPGRRSVTLEHAGYMEAAAARSHPVLNGLVVSGIVSALLGQNADPTTGDPVYSLAIRQGKYSVLPETGKYVPFTATFANRGELGGWGVALAVPVTFTNTANGAAVNNDAATTKGGAAFLHLLTAAATDRYSITVQGSATGAFAGEQTTLGTFSLNASAIGSEFITLAGTIPQYTRWLATRTSGSAGNTVKIAVSLVRF
jgi:hypothetical protein